jgi:CRP-like cAMP-binding protein
LITAGDLRRVTVFSGLETADLEWLAPLFTERCLDAGQTLFLEGDRAAELVAVIEGSLEARRRGQGGAGFAIRTGELGGLMPYSRMKTFPSDVTVLERARLGLLPKSRFLELLARLPQLGFNFVAALLDRTRDSSTQQQQQEKMIALGKLSAGLAHELNLGGAAGALQELPRPALPAAFAEPEPRPDRVSGRLSAPDRLSASLSLTAVIAQAGAVRRRDRRLAGRPGGPSGRRAGSDLRGGRLAPERPH